MIQSKKKVRIEKRRVHKTIERVLCELDYDFKEFSIEDFQKYLENFIQRKIYIFPWKMPTGLFGVWFTDSELPVEYIFYDSQLSGLGYQQTLLHEFGHILLRHQTERIVLNDFVMDGNILSFARLRHVDSVIDREELEAEMFSDLIQKKIQKEYRKKDIHKNIHTETQQLLSKLGG